MNDTVMAEDPGLAFWPRLRRYDGRAIEETELEVGTIGVIPEDVPDRPPALADPPRLLELDSARRKSDVPIREVLSESPFDCLGAVHEGKTITRRRLPEVAWQHAIGPPMPGCCVASTSDP